MKHLLIICSMLCMLLHMGGEEMFAQTTYRRFESYGRDTLCGMRDRFSWQVNLADWATLNPSVGMEVDLGKMDYAGCLSLLVQARYQSVAGTQLAMFADESDRWSGRAELRIHQPYHLFSGARMTDARTYYGLFAEPKMAGISAGYDLPGFGYRQRHFWQFQVGGGIGYAFAKGDEGHTICPELRVALVHRNVDIRRKYVLSRAQERSHELEIAKIRDALVQADQMIEKYAYSTNIYIDVDKLDKNGQLSSAVTKHQVIQAICQQTGMKLDEERFGGACDTIFPIRQLGDYNMTYNFPTALDKEGTPVNVRFRVELKGRREAEALKEQFVALLKQYHEKKGVPVLYAKAKPNSDDPLRIDGMLSWYEVQVLFQRLTGKHVSREMLQGIYYRPAAGVVKMVEKNGITRRGRYCVRIVFHPEVELNYDTDPLLCQFEVKFRGEHRTTAAPRR